MKVNINLRHLTAMQLSSRIFYILIGVIVVLFALFWIVGYDMPYDDNPDYSAPLLTDALIWFMIVLTFSTFGLAVFGAVNGMRKNKGENVVVNNVPARRISVSVIIGTALLLVLTYAFSSTDALLVNGERFTDTFWLRTAGMFIGTSLLLIVVAVGAVVFGAHATLGKSKRVKEPLPTLPVGEDLEGIKRLRKA